MPKKKSRRINSYNKPKLVKQAVKFPYKRVRIDWIDIITEGGWGTVKEFNKMKLATPVNEGWLYEKTDKHIKMFASYDKDEDGITFGDRTMIPRAWVRKIQKI